MEPPRLAQRGRAAIDFHCGVRAAAGRLQAGVEQELAAQSLTAATLPDDMDDRHQVIDAALEGYDPYRVRALLVEWTAKDHGPTALRAFEEIRHEIDPVLARLDEGPATLELDPDLEIPTYFSRVWFHRTTGGWDASPDNGYVHGELIHKFIITKAFGANIFALRRKVAEQAPRRDYTRILDMGASSGHFTLALAETFPGAAITGIDFSPRMLEHAKRTANEAGLPWALHQRAAEDTKFADGSFDLVASYNLLHELPPKIIKAIFAEALRVLEPGGHMVMADVPRYADLDKLASWRFDWMARWGGEPYWRSSATMDLKAAAESVGFTDVEAYALPGGQPYLVRGRKPEGTAQ
ncbi:MAG: class I SAM-dependent methyltransferase [Azospirillaceae bacterium]|nr:class I SAM-dependent methyltransferase [Azospirillaceae bacterium]